LKARVIAVGDVRFAPRFNYTDERGFLFERRKNSDARFNLSVLQSFSLFITMAGASIFGGKRFSKRQTWGVILLVVALLALVNRYLPSRSDYLILPLLGLGFTAWAVLGRLPGMLVPGGILLGVGCGIGAQRFYGLGAGTNAGQALFLCSLALGFLLITLFSLIFFRSRVVWPLWPAAFIGLSGAVRLMGTSWQEYVWRILPYWPFALLVFALWLLLFRRRGGKRS
jgi:hypothetical protein